MEQRAKIVCTIGPASRDPGTVARMAEAGMDVARINSGHQTVDEVLDTIALVCRAGEETGKRIGVMLDLQGPRVRVGPIEGSGVEVARGRELVLTAGDAPGDENRISVSYPGLSGDLKPGDSVLIDDGLIKMTVREVRESEVVCELVEGGVIHAGKGMNFPGASLSLPAFTERDRAYLKAGLEAGLDWVAQSFVRGADDVRLLRTAVEELGGKARIMAKVERAEAVSNIDEILKVADGLMVARGDLGVEMETEDVPLIQKELIERSMRAAVPVVTATQMLESMVDHPRPTRAEASDVANAILDGTDAVMLSAETAVGAYPVKVVETMARIVERTEKALDYGRALEGRAGWTQHGAADAIGYASCKMAADLDAGAIVAITRSGYTARLISRYRPGAPVIAASPDRGVVGGMSVVWGVRSFQLPITGDLRRTIMAAVEECVERGYLCRGDLTVVTCGFLDERAGTTNTIHVHRVE